MGRTDAAASSRRPRCSVAWPGHIIRPSKYPTFKFPGGPAPSTQTPRAWLSVGGCTGIVFGERGGLESAG
jgi:hypothetical protein